MVSLTLNGRKQLWPECAPPLRDTHVHPWTVGYAGHVNEMLDGVLGLPLPLLTAGVWEAGATEGVVTAPTAHDPGLRPVSRHSLDFVLSQPQQGQAVVIVIGGAQEALYTTPGQHSLELLNRKGFVRLALRHRASLVPVYSFGENDTFKGMNFSKGSWQYLCQVTCKRVTSIAPCIFWGRGLFSPNSWGLLPLPVPITTVVGAPIPVPQCSSPSQEQVDHYHRLYMDALERLFEEHKESCGVPASTRLTFF
ncbi:2-acylglycerol O-acyltransferase 3-like [Oryctolagus cuniculus]|uniref:2-acylglycerol O-acyltransferase 3-like n=1 Tax=Oryctolagus cuniculus TaxID=9986 RepID=UPI0003905288|nr:2-acylglycerol O-acyltransferase 3-like [Oryctolagus cuniculus]